MEYLKGKKVLFFATKDYSVGINNRMKELGIDVDCFNDKPNDNVVTKTLGRLHTPLFQKVLEEYYRKIIEAKKDKSYDYILIIKGEYTPINTLKRLKAQFPNAKRILYMWDSIRNNRGIEKKWGFFDRVITFDRKDYLENSSILDFIPLFYYEDYIKTDRDSDICYDIAFIGTGHGDRYKIIKQVQNQCESMGIKVYIFMYLPHQLIFYYNKLTNKNFKGAKKAEFSYKKLPFEEVYRIYSESNCVIDVESMTQTGLTMRTIEMIGLHKKMITTNSDIYNYDFFNSNNILVVNRNNFEIKSDFLETQYEEMDHTIYEKYSLEGWIRQVLD